MLARSKSIFNILTLFALITSLIGSAIFVTPAYAASIIANTNADNTTGGDSFCTLREAINNANADTDTTSGDCTAGNGADTITFAADYTITLAGSQLPQITTSIIINGNGAANTIIQANALPNTATRRVFEVRASGDLTLNSLTVRHGRFSDAGGGISNYGTLTIANSILSNNSGYNIGPGGAIYNLGILNITNSSFLNNASDLGGGAITMGNTATATITNTIFSNNSGISVGGGIWNAGTITLTNSTFTGNSADRGGGIFNETNGTLIVINSTFTGNPARQGGGIHNKFGTLRITNSTLSGNSARSGSVANFGGGIYNDDTLFISNTIIANSPSGGDCVNAGSISTNINNLIEDNTCSPDYSGDPILGALADNGGLTQTHALLAGSPAIDAGTNTGCPATDQRGVARPQNTTCDIGAFELDTTAPLITSTSLASSYTSPGPITFTFTFNENVNDAGNGANNDDVTNPDNYLLVEAGNNEVFDTTACDAGTLFGVQPDDTQVTVSSVTYNNSTFTATVSLNTALQEGKYRIFVCGTTSIVDLSANILNSGADSTYDFTVSSASTSSSLPETGFRHGRITSLPQQPAAKAYTETAMTLEIPKLGVSMPIVGVPQTENGWDVTWLGNSAGYLYGSSFPTWAGNTVITGHVWDAYNNPDIFSDLKTLKHGDQVQIKAWGMTYTYEVRESKLVTVKNVDAAFQSEQYDWLTLVTCEFYNPFNGEYLFRRAVRAVLISVK